MTPEERAALIHRITTDLNMVMELESTSHGKWDDSFSNLAFGRLLPEMREGYIKQTYQATGEHAKAMDILRRLEFWLKYGEELPPPPEATP